MSQGEIEPLLRLIEDKLLPRFSARDRRWMNELAVKTAFLTLLFQDVNYRLFSEPVVRFPSPEEEGDEPGTPRHGYADLVLLLRPDARATGLSDLLLEFKYLKPDVLGEAAGRLGVISRAELAQQPAVQTALAEAAEQARRYRAGLVERFGAILRLRSWAIVAVGLERLVAREVEVEPRSSVDQGSAS